MIVLVTAQVAFAGEASVEPGLFLQDGVRLERAEMRSAMLMAAEKAPEPDILSAGDDKMLGQGPRVTVGAGNNGIAVGVTQEFSTWRDIFAVFYPSRWAHPFQPGGTLSWLNYRAWATSPARTAKVLIGEGIIAGITYATVRKPGSGGHGTFGDSSGSLSAGSTLSSSGSGGSSSSGGGSSVTPEGTSSGGSSSETLPPVEVP